MMTGPGAQGASPRRSLPRLCDALNQSLECLRRHHGLDQEELHGLAGTAFAARLRELPAADQERIQGEMWDAIRQICSRAASGAGALGEAVEPRLRRAQRMEAIAQLAGVVGHEFNNYLMTIAGFTDLLLRSTASGDPLEAKLLQIKAAADQAAILTRQLQTIGSRRSTAPDRLDLVSLLDDLGPLVARLMGRKVAVELVKTDTALWAHVDRVLIEQVLVTLVARGRSKLSNGGRLILEAGATHVTPEGAGADAEVPEGRYVVLSVTDTGPGMSDEERQCAFEPFLGEDGGSGGGSLELSTVYGIVTQCGGHITVYSEVARGTTFRIYLPDAAATGRAERALQAVPAAPTAAPPTVGTGQLVLLVEDEDAIRQLARLVLQQSGYRVVEARDGGEALLLAEKAGAPIELLLTDYSLPRITGRELYERLRQSHPTLRALFMSGYTKSSITRPGESADAVAFLPKPFTPGALVAGVGEALRRAA